MLNSDLHRPIFGMQQWLHANAANQTINYGTTYNFSINNTTTENDITYNFSINNTTTKNDITNNSRTDNTTTYRYTVACMCNTKIMYSIVYYHYSDSRIPDLSYFLGCV